LLRSAARHVAGGGVAAFHIPVRSTATMAVSVSRIARSRIPGINALMNVLLRKPAQTPFFATTIYDLAQVLAILNEEGFLAPHVVFAHEGDTDTATIFAIREATAAPASVAAAAPAEEGQAGTASYIDVRALIRSMPLEEHNQRAERYFSSLRDRTGHLAKPFARAEDTPQLLINFGVLLQGLSLSPGMTVLEYGAGTGWLSHALTQLGCRAILLDVSATALDIARELYERQPPIGEVPGPSFMVFDGRHIDLPDSSVDRVICFDAFHHAPNPDEVLAEFGRVLRPGGVAGFVEPGPRHSMSPQSQFEMRTYGVIENDVDIEAIEQAARASGFADVRLAVLNVPPFLVSPDEYEDLMAGGRTLGLWGAITQNHLRDTRLFFLRREGEETLDSRRAEGLRSAIGVDLPGSVEAGTPIPIHAVVRNDGRAAWLKSSEKPGGVSLGCHLHDGEGNLRELDFAWIPLPRPMGPGEEVSLDAELPPLPAGRFILEFDCVADRVAWFAQTGSMPVRVGLTVERR
jgi:SAM-dependent methyltransferase